MIAIVAGCFGILLTISMRFFTYIKLPAKLRKKLVKVLFFTDMRQKNIETLEALLQIASIQWISFGLFYVVAIENLTFSPIYDKVIFYAILYAPILSVIMLGQYLKQKYWDSQK